MTLDRMTREAIASAVERAVRARMEIYDEEWLTAKELSHRLPIFGAEWLARFGNKLPRERLTVVDIEGNVRQGRTFMYPLHKIERMVAEGKHRHILSDVPLAGT